MAALTLTPELLASSTRDVAREIARIRLQRTLEEAARLEVQPAATTDGAVDGPAPPARADPEAVHDFRVALRRLRTWLRAFRPVLDDTVTGRSRRRLRRLWRLAGTARDLEVQQATLLTLTSAPNSAVATRARAFASHLANSAARARRKLTRHVIDDLPQAAAELAGQLQASESSVETTAPREPMAPLMAAAMAQLLHSQLGEFERSLVRLRRRGGIQRTHAVRIAGKRLRYLLDAFDRSSRLATTAVRRIATLQDAFGSLHDAQILERRLAVHRPSSLHRDPLRAAIRRRIRRDLRRAWKVARSRDIATARSATGRLIRQLERRAQGRA